MAICKRQCLCSGKPRMTSDFKQPWYAFSVVETVSLPSPSSPILASGHLLFLSRPFTSCFLCSRYFLNFCALPTEAALWSFFKGLSWRWCPPLVDRLGSVLAMLMDSFEDRLWESSVFPFTQKLKSFFMVTNSLILSEVFLGLLTSNPGPLS